MKQYRLMLYALLTLITGYMGIMMFCFNFDGRDINVHVLGYIFIISFIGHMISFIRDC